MARPADPMARIALLTSAEKVFSELGLERSKVEDIARAAGLSKGAFYLHFESKDAAFRQVVESFLARSSSLMDCDDTPGQGCTAKVSHKELLTFWLQKDIDIFEYFWANRTLVRMVRACSGSVVYVLDAFHAKHAARVEQLMKSLQDAGTFRTDFDAKFGAIIMLGGYHELTTLIVNAETKPDLRTIALEAQRTFVRAFAAPAVIRVAQTIKTDSPVNENSAHAYATSRN